MPVHPAHRNALICETDRLGVNERSDRTVWAARGAGNDILEGSLL
jgi:hypothetical protein